jgi:hypothetical protein
MEVGREVLAYFSRGEELSKTENNIDRDFVISHIIRIWIWYGSFNSDRNTKHACMAHVFNPADATLNQGHE